MTKKVAAKLPKLPSSPGVYYYFNRTGRIIYIGKAVSLKNRVRQYFQPASSVTADDKTRALIADIADLDWTTVTSELAAFLLENEMIQRYRPIYNIQQRDSNDQAFYVRIDRPARFPTVRLVRQRLPDRANYQGPYWRGRELRQVLRVLRRIFPYSTHTVLPRRACLQYDLGLCPGPETDSFDRDTYLDNLGRLEAVLAGRTRQIRAELVSARQAASDSQAYETAGVIQKQLQALEGLRSQVFFPELANWESNQDHACSQLQQLFKLPAVDRLEAYDVSHSGGRYTTGSLVVFRQGLPSRRDYRWFKLQPPGNDDYASLAEMLGRRLRPARRQSWPLPDLILVDGGRGQVAAVQAVLDRQQLRLPLIGLAKREEELVFDRRLEVNEDRVRQLQGRLTTSANFTSLGLPLTTPVLKLCQRLRDESHRLAVNSQRLVKGQRQLASRLTDVPGIGQVSRRRLLTHFGSLRRIQAASQSELTRVVGHHRATLIKQAFAKSGPD